MRVQRVQPRQVEGLIVERVGQLVRKREPLREPEVARAPVDELAGFGIVEADDLAGRNERYARYRSSSGPITPIVRHATVRRSYTVRG